MEEGWFPLSSAQSAMWQMQQFHSDVPINIAMYVDIQADIEPAVLRRASIAAGRELGSGYIRIADTGDGLRQRVDPDQDSTLYLVDTRDTSDPAAAAHEWMRADLTRPLNILRDRLIRAALIRIADSRWFWYLRAHHIVLDGYGALMLIERIAQQYSALVSGQAPEPARAAALPGLVAADAAYRDGPRAAADRAYWAERMNGYTAGPGLSERAGAPSAVGYTVRGELSEQVSDLLAAAAQRLGCSDTDLTISAFVAYLARMTGTRDVLVNLTVAARTTAELRRSAGAASNVVPLRIAVGAEATVADLIRSVRLAVVGAVRHQHYPYAEIRRNAGTEAQDIAGVLGPRINIMPFFADIRLGSATGRLHTLSAGIVDDIAVEVHPSGNGSRYRINLEFNPFRYSADRAHEHHLRFMEFLREVLSADPDLPVDELDVLGANERKLILAEWNSTDHPVEPELLHSGFARAAAAYPDRVAVAAEGVSWTYREFGARVDRLARSLVAMGAGPESFVAVAARRSPDLVVGLYAALTAGAAYVPLDPEHPRERIEYVLDTVRPICVLTAGEYPVPVPADIPVLRIDATAPGELEPAPARPVELRRPVRPENPAYVIFTSGSTGRPKGVVVSHAAINNQLAWMQSEYRMSADDIYLQKTATTFDVSVWGYFLPLRAGATLFVATPDGHRDPGYLAETIAAHRVTVTDFVPSMLGAFAAHTPPGAVPTLRDVFVIGEPLPPETAAALSAVSDAQAHNLYGPTEAAVSVTSWPVADLEDTGVPIGVPAWNTRVYVLDSRLRPVPPGVVGELYLGGVQLARGYAARPDLTADRFVADPFDAGLRMYRTGDLVRWRTLDGRGALDYVGRADFQIKLRGQRIELGEIESALLVQPTVRQAVVVLTPSESGGRLVAYVVRSAGTGIDRTELLDAVRETLPAYMVPAAVVVLDELPLTPNGKLDRRALPDPAFVPRKFRVPSGESEEVIAQIYVEVLGVAQVGADDDFFALGGDSLGSVQVVARAHQRGLRFTGRDVFEARTVAGLARRASPVEPAAATLSDAEPIPAGRRPVLAPGPRPENLPLSPAQRRMWFLNRFDADSAVDNIAAAVRLSGYLDSRRLQQAVADVIGRHEVLRTVYPERDGIACQELVPADRAVPDLTPVPVSEDELRSQVTAVISAGFDLTVAVPLRAVLYQLVGTDSDVPEHVLVFVVHHISADGWSMAPLTRDVMVAYEARRAGTAPAWSPLPVQYADYTLWQQKSLGSDDDPNSRGSQQADYWRAVLAGMPDELNLPADRTRPAVRSFTGGRVNFSIDADLRHSLGGLAQDNEATLFMVVHTAFAVLLARLSGSGDIVVGTPIAGRGAAELDDLIGMFVNTVVLRSRITGTSSFVDVLSATREADLDAFAHADLPFERLVELLSPPRSTARHPLFQVALSFENMPRRDFELPGLRVRPLDIDAGHAQFDLMLTVRERDRRDGGLAAEFSFARDLFDAPTVTGFARRFVRLLTAITVSPRVPVGDLPLLDEAEAARLTRVHDRRAVPATLLPDFLARGARLDPAQVAVRSRGRSITYRELDEYSSRLARVLIAHGAGPERVVALAFPRSFETVAAFWAVTKTGAAHVPVDPAYPPDRVRYLISDSGALVGLTLRAIVDRLPGNTQWLVLDDPVLDERIATRSPASVTDTDRIAPLDPRHPAYVIYTSGSTGLPKGVAVTHSGFGSIVAEATERYRLQPQHRFLHICSPSFDPSILEWVCAAAVGATSVIAPADIQGGPALAEFLRSEQVTHAVITPGVLGTMDPSGLTDLEVVSVGGDVTTQELLAEWAPGRRYLNSYGPTEATIVSSYAPLTPGRRITVGTPVRGVSALVLDERLHPVPPGVAGELYLAGPGLARGYHHRPDLTAHRFVANPWAKPGGLMYRTGDVVRWYAEPEPAGDGTAASAGHALEYSHALEYIGRSDFQVKIRGFRIELGEVDAALGRHPAIAFAVTVGKKTTTGETALVAYLVAAPGHLIDIGDVTRFAAGTLPSYMVPGTIMVLDEIPLTPVGKLDRSALPEPALGGREFRAPGSPVESTIAGVFAELLGVTRVGADDDFFDLGGNSLSALRLVARLNDALAMDFTIRDLFETSTVAELATLADHRRGPVDSTASSGDARPVRIPLSPAQQRMWLLNQSDRDSAAYNIPIAIRLTGELDVTALRAAISDVVARHRPLRTRYPEDAHGPVQEVLTPLDGALPLVAVADEAGLHAGIHAATTAGFDVAGEVPVRITLFRRTGDSETGPAGGDHVLLLVAHHIAVDGWSTVPLARDVVTAYTARAGGTRPGWSPLPMDYADYTLRHRKQLGDDDDPGSLAATQLAYWRAELAELPEQPGFPGDRRRPPAPSAGCGTVEFTVGSDIVTELRSLARAHRATAFMVVHTALAVLLARLSNTDDVAIGVPVAGRGDAALDDLVGMFVNTLVLRSHIDPAERFTTLLERQRRTDLAAFAHADVPLDSVLDMLRANRPNHRAPLFRVALAYQNLPAVEVELPGLRVTALDLPAHAAMFDLTVTVVDDAPSGELRGRISYDTDLFDGSTVHRIAARLVRILSTVVADPAVPLGDIDLILDTERTEILRDRGRIGVDTAATTLVDLVDASVSAHPDAIAVTDGATTLTYTELSRRADLVAARLNRSGVGPGTLVAVALERTAQMPVALLGVLRAGAGYLPLDPHWPSRRLEFVLSTAGPAVVITSTDLVPELPVGDWTVLLVDSDLSTAADLPTPPPVRATAARADDLAYVIFTSGSTGTPKGVAVTHRNAVQLFANALPNFDLDHTDVWTVFHSFAFDFAVWELWGALVTGATAVIVDHATSRSPDKLWELIFRERVTVLAQTPTAFYQLADSDHGVETRASLLPRYLIFGGEALDTDRLADWYDRHDENRPRLVNMYGITETTVHVTVQSLARGTVDERARGSLIGRGLSGLTTHILDGRLRPTPSGSTGEIYVAGGQVARGYLGRPGLTATRFVADPAGPPGARMYRSGDLGSWSRGRLHYVGRGDQQVQLRGFRIETGEIESVLSAHHGVGDARVIVRDGRLLAYVRDTDPAVVPGLRDELAQQLPEHMIPAAIIRVEAWPTTVNGKLDARALPEPDFIAGAARRPPRTDREKALAAAFAEVLELPAVGIDDDFFRMGGDSVRAVRLRSRVRTILRTEISVQDVFEARTVAALAAISARPIGLPARGDAVRPDTVALSFPQQRLAELNEHERLEPGPGRAYAFALRLSEHMEPETVSAALLDLTTRHEVLRTVFPGQQRILPPGSIDFAVMTGQELPSLLARPFDVRSEVPLRVRLIPDPDEGTARLLIVLHHIAADGWSIAPLVQDFAAALSARAAGARPDQEPLQIQYAHHSTWQHDLLSDLGHGTEIDRQLSYWTERLTALPAPPPMLVRRPGAPQPTAGVRHTYLDPNLYRALRGFADHHETSVFTVVHTAFALTLRETGFGDDLAICAPTAGRTETALEAAIGRFTNFLVLRCDLSANTEFTKLVDTLGGIRVAALDHQDIPFEFLVDRFDIRDRLRIRLAFQNIPTADLRGSGLAARWEPITVSAPADFDLSLILSEQKNDHDRAEALFGSVEYATDVVDADLADRIARRFEEILAAGIAGYGQNPALRSA
ncbi:non-ribosomal peptide synthetase [Nocardia sp. NBC_00416]|uniref:non-ribosomal peptide synthetase n=1 Tax=Nocardia sp. NBC_00416 TaxID=2975991 RepID=UPI002E20162F|nr:non-ribosomal peptide synthetase [Nocardia sp. NBC_00416]